MESLDSEILNQLKELNILTRVNNVLLSKFILQLQTVKRELHLPRLVSFFRFEILKDEYEELCEEYGRNEVDKALYHLDRQLVRNKLECPNNIKRYIKTQMRKTERNREIYRRRKEEESEEEES